MKLLSEHHDVMLVVIVPVQTYLFTDHCPRALLINGLVYIFMTLKLYCCLTYSHAVSVLESVEDFFCVPVPYLKSTQEALLT